MIDAVIEKFRSLRLKHCSENIAAIIEQAEQHNHSHLQAIDRLLDIEIEAREQSRIVLRFKITHKVKNGKFKPGTKEMLEFLLTKGADINYPTSKSGSTHLMFASKMAWLEPVEFYLAHGADVNARDKKGKTALSLAKTKRKVEQPYEEENRKAIIELLKSKGAR